MGRNKKQHHAGSRTGTGPIPKKETKQWFDEECQKKVNKKNTARMKWIGTNKEEHWNDYRKERTKLCKKKKEEWINNYMKEIQHKNKDNRKLFELIKKQPKKRQINAKIDKKDWEAHFKNMYE
ncbi:hypothetical protein Zmor_026369 [Zophobas morio]|uniref:Uncharacterized protein n=1 Tax=Zophobas morio TaxID=2755281 RepID=A0AA38M5W6_9CUCU|nr:hypothetical protein Zmor_026369 [Zophobas morio]